MSIRVSCKTCWFDFSVREDSEGKVTYCPNCGSRIILDVERTFTNRQFDLVGADWGGSASALTGHTVVHQYP